MFINVNVFQNKTNTYNEEITKRFLFKILNHLRYNRKACILHTFERRHQDMLNKLFGKKPESEIIKAPINGNIVSIEQVPDPTFSQKMMGDGVAIEPTDGKVVSPIEGKVVQVFPTKHAIGLKSKNGLELLIHIGLETVNMQGEGFTAHVSEGDKVKVGDPLVDFDLELVKDKANSILTPIVITNGDDVASKIEKSEGTIAQGETSVMTVHFS